MLVDSHCHLNFPEFSENLDEIIENAKNNGISVMQTICTKLAEFDEVYAIADKYENIFCSVGVHPHEADNEQVETAMLKTLTKWPKVIGIGETGLDYYYKNSSIENQKQNFEKHLIVASETQIPIIIHTRDAEADTYDMLNINMKQNPYTGLLHCFTGTKDLAKKALDLGLYISISGIVTFKKATELQDIVKNYIPLNRLLVETDSPFLAPIPYRGKVNQPAYTKNTAEFIANLKGVTLKEVAEATTQNFYNLFRKAS